MLKRIAKTLTNNIGLKILAILAAIALWMVVINIDDPNVRRSQTISVTLENTNYLTSLNKYSDILNTNNTVTFYYTAKRSVYSNLSNSDFKATANMEKIEFDEESGKYRVPVEVTSNRAVTIESKQLYLELALEDLNKKQFPIKANTTGTVADGCALGEIEINSANVIKISGPASVVNMIDTVMATINVEGMTTDITDNVVPVLYDADGNVIETTKLTLSVESVNISAQILNTKDVALEFLTMGEMAENYRIVEITSNPKTVRVKGDAAVLNTLDKITIPEEVLDLTDAQATVEKNVDISSYLPEGVSLVISSDAKVDVKVEIEKVETRTFDIPVENITIDGLGEGLSAEIDEEVIQVLVTGGVADLDKLDEASITGVINAADLRRGTHFLKVEMDLDQEVFLVSNVYANVVIRRVEE